MGPYEYLTIFVAVILGLAVAIVVFGAAFLVAIRSSNRTYHRVLALAWLMERPWWGVGALGEPLITL